MRLSFLILVFLWSTVASAQVGVAALQARLLGQPLFLRGQWGDRKLAFDASGHLVGASETVPFTLSGMDVSSLHLDAKGLKVNGRRAGLVFSKDGMSRVQTDDGIQLTIAAPSNGDYSEVLDIIFFKKASDFIPSLPDYWKGAYTEALLTGSALPEPAKPVMEDGITHRIGGGVAPPQALYTAEPKFNKYARKVKLNGNVLVYLQVDRNGNPAKVRILHPLGLGLDEASVAAVSAYRFAPATENGAPVRVEMNVQVNFEIF